MQKILKQAVNCSYEDDAIVLSKAAKIIREDILNSNITEFNGSFCADCQQQSVPTNVKYFVSMLLNGCTIKDQDSQSCLTISQTIVFNCKRKSKASHYHSRKFEPPLPLYLLKMHIQTILRTSGFFRRGKRMAWEAWNSFPEITSVFPRYTPVVLQPYNIHMWMLNLHILGCWKDIQFSYTIRAARWNM